MAEKSLIPKKKVSVTQPFVLWFTGLSGAGKSTLASAFSEKFKKAASRLEQLDGDVVRDLFPKTGFSKEERNMHIRRIGFLAGMLERNGVSVICSFISPYRESRQFVRANTKNFIEVYVSTPLETCEARDPKGLYQRVRKGEISQFTGIDDPYEEPENPELIINTVDHNINECVETVFAYLNQKGFINSFDEHGGA